MHSAHVSYLSELGKNMAASTAIEMLSLTLCNEQAENCICNRYGCDGIIIITITEQNFNIWSIEMDW